MTTFKRYTGTDWEYISFPDNVGLSPQTLGYAQVTASQTGITTPAVDLTGLSVTVTVPEGRRIRIIGQVRSWASTVNDDRVSFSIQEGSTVLNQLITPTDPNAGSSTGGVPVIAIISPSAGTHTYKLTADSVDSGSVSMIAASTFPAFILVEDITGSTLPYQPASVPVGLLGQAIVTTDQSGIGTSSTDITGLSVNVAVPAGRVLRVTGSLLLGAFSNTSMRANIRIFDQNGVQYALDQVGPVVATTVNTDRHVTAIISPPAGVHTFRLNGIVSLAAGTFSSLAAPDNPARLIVEDITPTPAPSEGAPGSTLGYAEVTASQTGISTSNVDLTGLSVNISVPAGRRIRITGYGTFDNQNASQNAIALNIFEGATRLNFAQGVGDPSGGSAGDLTTLSPSVVVSPSAGSHTYKLSAVVSLATCDLVASATAPAFILVEDVTGSVWPEGSQVTLGIIAQEPWQTWSPVITQSGTVAATNTASFYTRIGRTIHVRLNLTVTGTGTASNIVTVSLPVDLAAGHITIGSGFIFDSSANLVYKAIVEPSGVSAVRFRPTNTVANDHLGTAVFTAALASGDIVECSITYEAAS